MEQPDTDGEESEQESGNEGTVLGSRVGGFKDAREQGSSESGVSTMDQSTTQVENMLTVDESTRVGQGESSQTQELEEDQEDEENEENDEDGVENDNGDRQIEDQSSATPGDGAFSSTVTLPNMGASGLVTSSTPSESDDSGSDSDSESSSDSDSDSNSENDSDSDFDTDSDSDDEQDLDRLLAAAKLSAQRSAQSGSASTPDIALAGEVNAEAGLGEESILKLDSTDDIRDA